MAPGFHLSPRPLASWWSRLTRDPWSDRIDWQYDADTSGTIRKDALGLSSPNAAHATIYRAALGWVIRLFLRRLPIDYRRFTFVDFGSGKGRALLAATEFDFASIIGVELSPVLHQTALRNIARLPEGRRRLVRALLQDAASFALPGGDLVAFLYNPFGPAILDQVAARLAARGARGHAVFVIYINPKFRDVFERLDAFEPVFEHRKGVIFRYRSAKR
ncbi:MAG TPA: hypothetical protein VJ476_04025 [Rhizomicrobium sp.]|nr:hypothetical protein [Rhizomicrobium sp.]